MVILRPAEATPWHVLTLEHASQTLLLFCTLIIVGVHVEDGGTCIKGEGGGDGGTSGFKIRSDLVSFSFLQSVS